MFTTFCRCNGITSYDEKSSCTPSNSTNVHHCRPLYFYSSVCAVPPAYLGYDGSWMDLTSLIDLVLCVNSSSDIMVPSMIDLAVA
ncbi:unnamed protein product [Urochloa humidicola]